MPVAQTATNFNIILFILRKVYNNNKGIQSDYDHLLKLNQDCLARLFYQLHNNLILSTENFVRSIVT
jgi:hypothetical protein